VQVTGDEAKSKRSANFQRFIIQRVSGISLTCLTHNVHQLIFERLEARIGLGVGL
jgi:hypothetical protein